MWRALPCRLSGRRGACGEVIACKMKSACHVQVQQVLRVPLEVSCLRLAGRFGRTGGDILGSLGGCTQARRHAGACAQALLQAGAALRFAGPEGQGWVRATAGCTAEKSREEPSQ